MCQALEEYQRDSLLPAQCSSWSWEKCINIQTLTCSFFDCRCAGVGIGEANTGLGFQLFKNKWLLKSLKLAIKMMFFSV